MMRLIVAGSRSFDDYERASQEIDAALRGWDVPIIISGGAQGADALAMRYAKEHDILFELFTADWDEYGKRAGIVRNARMAEHGDALLAFWDGVSKGTKHMISCAKRRQVPTRIVRFGIKGLDIEEKQGNLF